MSDCEIAYSSFDSPSRIWVKNRCILKQYGTIHPTEKPVNLYKFILNNYAKQGDKIFDSHFGSLSIGIACHDLGFDLDACELDIDYFNDGKNRLEHHKQQLQLF